jgi:hypothetical protein
MPLHHKSAYIKIWSHSCLVSFRMDRKITPYPSNWSATAKKWCQEISCCLLTTPLMFMHTWSTPWSLEAPWQEGDYIQGSQSVYINEVKVKVIYSVCLERLSNQSLMCYLELGHLTTSEKTTLFAQFLLVSHEVRCETGVKDKFLTICPLSLGPGPLYQIICISFLRCPRFRGRIVSKPKSTTHII